MAPSLAVKAEDSDDEDYPDSSISFEISRNLTKSQELRLAYLQASFGEEHGPNADKITILLSAKSTASWPIFTILYPHVAFQIEKVVDVVREVDKIFIDEYDLKLYGIQDPLQYVNHSDRFVEWKERFEILIAAGPESSQWADHMWEFKAEAKKVEGGGMIRGLEEGPVYVDARLKGFLEKGMDGIRTRLLFLTKALAVVKRIEEEYESEKNGLQ